MRKTLIIIFLTLSVCPIKADNTMQHTINFSHGFKDKSSVYFLFEYKKWKPRRPIFFIMPIERPTAVYYHKIFFYRFNTVTGSPQRLSILLDKPGRGINIKSTKFVKTGDTLNFTFPAGWSKDAGILHIIKAWSLSSKKFTGTVSDTPVADSSQIYRELFGSYKSPWSANPGIITITELKTRILKDEDFKTWDLPE